MCVCSIGHRGGNPEPNESMKIALPVETKVRELFGKLWLALNLVDDGHTVILGEENDIIENLHRIAPDAYFRNSAVFTPRRAQRLEYLQEAGCKVVVLDTEGGIYRSEKAFLDRLSPDILRHSDVYLAWGEGPAAILRKNREFSEDRILVSGNPRFDVIQADIVEIYESPAKVLTEKYGSMILINTNFTLANSFTKRGSYPAEHIAYQRILVDHFTSMVESLAMDYCEHSIVIRPHPSEDLQRYRSRFKDLDSVFVKHHGDVRSWIYASDAVIHNSCTTGIEAALMRTPVISYRPVKSAAYDLELPNVVSIEANRYDALKTALDANLGKRYSLDEDQDARLKRHIHNIDASSTSVIVDMIREFGDVTADRDDFGSLRPPATILVKRLMMEYAGIKRTERFLEILGLSSYRYKRQKFPGLTPGELRDKARLFADYIDVEQVLITELDLPGYIYSLSTE